MSFCEGRKVRFDEGPEGELYSVTISADAYSWGEYFRVSIQLKRFIPHS